MKQYLITDEWLKQKGIDTKELEEEEVLISWTKGFIKEYIEESYSRIFFNKKPTEEEKEDLLNESEQEIMDIDCSDINEYIFDILVKNRKKILLEKIEYILFDEKRSVILKQEDTDILVNIIINKIEEDNIRLQLFENGKRLKEVRVSDVTQEETMEEIEDYLNQDYKLFI